MKNPEYITIPIIVLILLAVTNLVYVISSMSKDIDDMYQQNLVWFNDIYDEQLELKSLIKEKD